MIVHWLERGRYKNTRHKQTLKPGHASGWRAFKIWNRPGVVALIVLDSHKTVIDYYSIEDIKLPIRWKALIDGSQDKAKQSKKGRRNRVTSI